MKVFKRIAIFMAVFAAVTCCTFAATIPWAMTHVEVYETPHGVELVLGDNVWLHNER